MTTKGITRTYGADPKGRQRVSPRMQKAHELRASGLSCKKVAELMGISARTVSTLCSRYNDAIEDGVVVDTLKSAS